MAINQEEKITEIALECAQTRAREVKGLRGTMSQQREKMSTKYRNQAGKPGRRTAWYLKWERHCSRLEQQEEASRLKPPGHSQLSSCLTLTGVNIYPHRWDPRLQEDPSGAQREQTFRKMHMNTAMRYHLTPVTMAVIRNKCFQSKCWWGPEISATKAHCCWEGKVVQLQWKVWCSSKTEM